MTHGAVTCNTYFGCSCWWLWSLPICDQKIIIRVLLILAIQDCLPCFFILFCVSLFFPDSLHHGPKTWAWHWSAAALEMIIHPNLLPFHPANPSQHALGWLEERKRKKSGAGRGNQVRDGIGKQGQRALQEEVVGKKKTRKRWQKPRGPRAIQKWREESM